MKFITRLIPSNQRKLAAPAFVLFYCLVIRVQLADSSEVRCVCSREEYIKQPAVEQPLKCCVR